MVKLTENARSGNRLRKIQGWKNIFNNKSGFKEKNDINKKSDIFKNLN